MQGSKVWGWVLLVVGLVGAYLAYSSSFGMTGTVVMIIVALVGAWMAFFTSGNQQPPM